MEYRIQREYHISQDQPITTGERIIHDTFKAIHNFYYTLLAVMNELFGERLPNI